MAQGHKRNADETKARLLEAAQDVFAQHGYASAGIRDIAARAGANSALLARYFGSKAAIFEASLMASINIDALMMDDRDRFGERLSRYLLDDQATAHRLAFAVPTNDAVGAEIVARVTEDYAIQPLARWLGAPNERARAMKIIMLASSVCLFLRHDRHRSSGVDEAHSLQEWFASSVQAIVDLS